MLLGTVQEQENYTVFELDNSAKHFSDWTNYISNFDDRANHCNPFLVQSLAEGFKHKAYMIEAKKQEAIVGLLPLVHVQSYLFGSHLISLPYFDWAGVVTTNHHIAEKLIDVAIKMADQLNVNYLELRNTDEIQHSKLSSKGSKKFQMRLDLTNGQDAVWKCLKSVVRTQIRKGIKNKLTFHWGNEELLSDFYEIFCRNMRDLGTPVYSRSLFATFLKNFPDHIELGIVKKGNVPVSGCFAIHGKNVTEVPSASTLKNYRSTAANSFMYWRCIERAIERNQKYFDFGRSSYDSKTFEFKKKWGTEPKATAWQYYVLQGNATDLRPENPKFKFAIEAWKRLPLSVTKAIGPMIVRGIP